MSNAVYPGSFDPVTYGHIDVIKRASHLFDTLTVSVLNNGAKTPLFSVDERVKMLQDVCRDIPNVRVDSFSGLTARYVQDNHFDVIIRGLRAVTDFEYELQIAQTNRELSHNRVDTVFLVTNLRYSYLSSSTVKEIASYKGDVSGIVTENVLAALNDRFDIDAGNVKKSEE
jgi:pantetheine-phosphate adenylyltransferase